MDYIHSPYCNLFFDLSGLIDVENCLQKTPFIAHEIASSHNRISSMDNLSVNLVLAVSIPSSQAGVTWHQNSIFESICSACWQNKLLIFAVYLKLPCQPVLFKQKSIVNEMCRHIQISI